MSRRIRDNLILLGSHRFLSVSLGHAGIPREQVHAFAERLQQFVEDFEQ